MDRMMVRMEVGGCSNHREMSQVAQLRNKVTHLSRAGCEPDEDIASLKRGLQEAHRVSAFYETAQYSLRIVAIYRKHKPSAEASAERRIDWIRCIQYGSSRVFVRMFFP